MKNFATFTTALVFLGVNVSNVLAGCFTSGESWGNENNRQFARDFAVDFCNGAGFWAPGEAKSFCGQITPTLKVDLFVQNLNVDAGFALRPEDCMLRLQNEINGCWQGGQSDVSGWRFRSDPNNGIC